MIRFLKKIWRSMVVLFLATVFSFCLFMMFLNPLRPVFFLGERLSAATSIGSSASVPLNPINKLAMQLEEKEKQLTEKERFLDERALAMERDNSVWRNRVMLGILLGLILIFCLVLANFYFDSKRAKELERLEKRQ
jgi:hypothetical protein